MYNEKKRKKETKGHIILNLQQVALPKYIIMLLQSHTHWLYHSWLSVMARSKSMPQSSGRLDDLDPLIALTAERKRAIEMRHLIRYMICEKGICFLSERVFCRGIHLDKAHPFLPYLQPH